MSFAGVNSVNGKVSGNLCKVSVPFFESVVLCGIVISLYILSRSNGSLAGNNSLRFFAAVPSKGYGVLLKNVLVNLAVAVLIKNILDIFDSVVNILLGVLVAVFVVLLVLNILDDIFNFFLGFIVKVNIIDIVNEVVEVLVFDNLVLCGVGCALGYVCFNISGIPAGEYIGLVAVGGLNFKALFNRRNVDLCALEEILIGIVGNIVIILFS